MVKKNTLKYYIVLLFSVIIIMLLTITIGCSSMTLPVSGDTSTSESIQSTIISEEKQEDSTGSSEEGNETTTSGQTSDSQQTEDNGSEDDKLRNYENDFTLNNLSGEKVSLSDFAGNIVVLNFWATWCPPCKAEIPDFVELYSVYKDQGVVFLGVSLDDDLNALKQFIFDNNIIYPIVIDNQIANVSGNWGINAIPTTYFIDTDGNILDKWLGQIPKKELDSILKGLLGRNKA